MLTRIILALLVVLCIYLGARTWAAIMLLKRYHTGSLLINDAKHLEGAPIVIFTFVITVIGTYLFYASYF